MDAEKIRGTMLNLRQDALGRGMLELAIIYGWSAIRAGDGLLDGSKPLSEIASSATLASGSHPTGKP